MSRFHRAAAVAALCLTALAACGDPGSKAVPAAGESQATTPTTAPESTTSTTAANPLEVVLASSGKVAASRTMRFSMTMGTPQGSFTGEGAMDTSGGVMTMTMDMASLLPPEARQAGSKVEMILKDEAMYMQYPGLAAEAGGKHWIRVDFAALGAAGQLTSLATQLREADPSKNVAFLAGAKDVTTIGAETVRGVATTHYKLTIDMQKALVEIPADLRSTVSSAIAQLGLTTLPAEVWLDGDGLPRRFT
ncbi:MAG TPA: hypothetical protein VG795_16030, partial [Acidimicrobiia bacterium]|nr:hypothetical protein [Acidimicrobiia bacterium]